MKKKMVNMWRILVNLWSIIFFIAIFYDFLGHNSLNGLLNIISTVYIAVLMIYVGDKEFERWYAKIEGIHLGEIFVFIWTGIMIALLILDLLKKELYHVPDCVVTAYVSVLTILVITRKSKQVYQEKK
jgi:hypothetical protein